MKKINSKLTFYFFRFLIWKCMIQLTVIDPLLELATHISLFYMNSRGYTERAEVTMDADNDIIIMYNPKKVEPVKRYNTDGTYDFELRRM